MKLIDLHTHTNYSDGTATVEQTLVLAEGIGLSFLSVTDHNTVNAYDELLRKKHLFSGKLVSGVELSTTFRSESIEITNVIDVIFCAVVMSAFLRRIVKYYQALLSLDERATQIGGVKIW